MSLPALTRARQFRALAAAVCLALILPRIAQAGMFVDGVTYAVLSRNLAAGVGTFWSPSFSSTVYPVFFEQPPLGIALESLAFRMLGDHLYVERLFSVLVFALTALLIVALWRMLLPRDYDWLPLFFWVLPSPVTWAAVNNMLEATQALLTTAAVLLIVRAMRDERMSRRILASTAAAFALVGAFLTKGPVGLFPLAVPPLALLIAPGDRQRRLTVAVVWGTLLLVSGVLAAVILATPAASHALSEFARTHVVPALAGERGLPRRSFDIARHFTLGILARMVALAVLLWLIRPRGRDASPVRWNAALFLLGVGLIASLPLLASPVLAGHYFVPSVPFFALAVAAATLPAVEAYRARSSGRGRFVPLALAVTLAAFSILVPLVRGPMERRDSTLIAALRAIEADLPRGATIGTCAIAAQDWGLHGYFQRFYRISLAATDRPEDGWFLIRRSACGAPAGCAEVRANGELAFHRCAVE